MLPQKVSFPLSIHKKSLRPFRGTAGSRIPAEGYQPDRFAPISPTTARKVMQMNSLFNVSYLLRFKIFCVCSLNFAAGVGDVYFAIQFVSDRCQVFVPFFIISFHTGEYSARGTICSL